ncbi:MAG: hypothetical protein ABIG11_11205, partial [bacterium]
DGGQALCGYKIVFLSHAIVKLFMTHYNVGPAVCSPDFARQRRGTKSAISEMNVIKLRHVL